VSIAGPLSKISGGPSVGFTADASVWTLYSRRGSGENWLKRTGGSFGFDQGDVVLRICAHNAAKMR
jgi:hypothetical protein